MSVFSRYRKVLEADGNPMRVRTALQIINSYIDEFLNEQEGEFDPDTRWALTWFEQYQFEARDNTAMRKLYLKPKIPVSKV